MYQISIGFTEAIERIKALQKNGHHAEALVTSVFTLEKLMRRALKSAILSRGFTSKQSGRLIERKGFKDLKELWDIFDKEHRTLPEFIGNSIWQHIPKAVEMRNSMVHGSGVYKLSICKDYSEHVMKALKKLHEQVLVNYETDPWVKFTSRRKSKLQWFPLEERKLS